MAYTYTIHHFPRAWYILAWKDSDSAVEEVLRSTYPEATLIDPKYVADQIRGDRKFSPDDILAIIPDKEEFSQPGCIGTVCIGHKDSISGDFIRIDAVSTEQKPHLCSKPPTTPK